MDRMEEGCEFFVKDTKGCMLANNVSKGWKTITNFKCEYNDCYYKQFKEKSKRLNDLYNNSLKFKTNIFDALELDVDGKPISEIKTLKDRVSDSEKILHDIISRKKGCDCELQSWGCSGLELCTVISLVEDYLRGIK